MAQGTGLVNWLHCLRWTGTQRSVGERRQCRPDFGDRIWANLWIFVTNPGTSWSRVGLRVAAPVLAVALVAVTALLMLQREKTQEQSTAALQVYVGLLGKVVVNDLRQAMLAEDRTRIQRELSKLSELSPIRSVRLIDHRGHVAAASDTAAVGKTLARTDATCTACHQGNGPAARMGQATRVDSESGVAIYRAVQPIVLEKACEDCHEQRAGQMAGMLVIELDDDAVTGPLRRDAQRLAWATAAILLGVLALLFLVLRRQVLSRLKNLGHLLELLRTGARAAVLTPGASDEIDDLTRAVQALTLDLDGRLGLERLSRRLVPLLERQQGPALLLDAQGVICASNREAGRLCPPGARRLIGVPRAAFDSEITAQYEEAKSQGWSLPATDAAVAAPTVAALHNRDQQLLGFVEVWPDPPTQTEPLPLPTLLPPPDAAEWSHYAVALMLAARSPKSSSAQVMPLDARLARARRLAGELAQQAGQVALDQDDIELKSLLLICMWDAGRQLGERHWHCLSGEPVRLSGLRCQVRVLVERLVRAAGRQTPVGGSVVTFQVPGPRQDTVLLGAWSSQPGGQTLVDPSGSPALAQAIAQSHGGHVEVDPDFDLSELKGFVSEGLPCSGRGTLYVADLQNRAFALNRSWGMV